MPNETDRPQTFEEWFAENRTHFSAMSPLRYSSRESAEKAWHARDAAFAQVEDDHREALRTRDAEIARLYGTLNAIRDRKFDYMDSDEAGCPDCGWFEAHQPNCRLADIRRYIAQVEKERDQLMKLVEALRIIANRGCMDTGDGCDSCIAREALAGLEKP